MNEMNSSAGRYLKFMIFIWHTASKVPKYGVFAGPYFPVFGLNTDIYGANPRIQSEYRKMLTGKNSAFGHFTQWYLLTDSVFELTSPHKIHSIFKYKRSFLFFIIFMESNFKFVSKEIQWFCRLCFVYYNFLRFLF